MIEDFILLQTRPQSQIPRYTPRQAFLSLLRLFPNTRQIIRSQSLSRPTLAILREELGSPLPILRERSRPERRPSPK